MEVTARSRWRDPGPTWAPRRPAVPDPSAADHGTGDLTDRGRARLKAALQAGDSGLEVTVAWHAYQDLRSMFHAPTPAGPTAQRVLKPSTAARSRRSHGWVGRCGRGGARCWPTSMMTLPGTASATAAPRPST